MRGRQLFNSDDNWGQVTGSAACAAPRFSLVQRISGLEFAGRMLRSTKLLRPCRYQVSRDHSQPAQKRHVASLKLRGDFASEVKLVQLSKLGIATQTATQRLAGRVGNFLYRICVPAVGDVCELNWGIPEPWS